MGCFLAEIKNLEKNCDNKNKRYKVFLVKL